MTSQDLSRRAVLVGTCGTCAMALTACAGYGSGGSSTPPAAVQPAPSEKGQAGSAAAALASTADIPVGGGKVFADKDVVVTQPAAGTFKAFSATCTHQGCKVAAVAGGTINCPCHGSKFKIADGSVANGPANKPLPAKTIKVDGTSITPA
jgi:Rieske Fe-S protein